MHLSGAAVRASRCSRSLPPQFSPLSSSHPSSPLPSPAHPFHLPLISISVSPPASPSPPLTTLSSVKSGLGTSAATPPTPRVLPPLHHLHHHSFSLCQTNLQLLLLTSMFPVKVLCLPPLQQQFLPPQPFPFFLSFNINYGSKCLQFSAGQCFFFFFKCSVQRV